MKTFPFIVIPVFIQAITAPMVETKPSANDSYALADAVDGDLNKYTAAELNLLDKKHFDLLIGFFQIMEL